MNFQNIPREEKLIKGAFRPKLDYFLYFDYSQIEYRMLAYYMAGQLGDEYLADQFKAGVDAHTATARLLFGLKPDVVPTDRQRQLAKSANFSVIYMGGIPAIMRYGKCDKKTAGELLTKIKANMPGVADLFEEIVYAHRARGYIRTIAGRHLAIDPAVAAKRGADRAEAALLNYLIQGGAAELIRHALIKVHCWLKEAGLASHMVNQVHDEIQIDGVWDELDLLLEAIPPLMGDEEVEKFVPIKVDVEISDTTWAEKRPLKEYLEHTRV